MGFAANVGDFRLFTLNAMRTLCIYLLCHTFALLYVWCLVGICESSANMHDDLYTFSAVDYDRATVSAKTTSEYSVLTEDLDMLEFHCKS